MFKKFENWINATLKAHAGGLAAALTLLISDGGDMSNLSANQWYGLLGAYLGAGVMVYHATNIPAGAPAVESVPDVNTQDDGTNG